MVEDYKNDELLKEYILKDFMYIKSGGVLFRQPRSVNSKLIGPQMLGKNRNRSGKIPWTIMVCGKVIPAENIAFLLVTGRWPKGIIGFKSGKKYNIAWHNLITEGT